MPRELAAIRDRLFSAILSDALDAVGRSHQALPHWIRPVHDNTIVCGRARTGLYREVYEHQPGTNPYALEIELVDSLKADQVAVLAVNGSRRIAPWGELLSTAATVRGAAGCVTDGLVRDVKRIREIGFPTFCGGFGPLDSKGRGEMVAVDALVEIGGVPVAPGDLVFGDLDGVVVVPQAVEADVLEFAFSKVEAEDTTRAELMAGASLADVFRRHGIL